LYVRVLLYIGIRRQCTRQLAGLYLSPSVGYEHFESNLLLLRKVNIFATPACLLKTKNDLHL
jgi:hypothetical protein